MGEKWGRLGVLNFPDRSTTFRRLPTSRLPQVWVYVLAVVAAITRSSAVFLEYGCRLIGARTSAARGVRGSTRDDERPRTEDETLAPVVRRSVACASSFLDRRATADRAPITNQLRRTLLASRFTVV